MFYASDAFVSAKLPDPSEVTVVGAYDPASTEFDDFVNNLSGGLKTKMGASVSVSQRRSVKKYANRWHAKIFIARQGNQHRFAVIGSSNLTRNAFDTSASNNEADVLIWDDAHSETQQLAATTLAPTLPTPNENELEPPEVLISNYDPDDNRNSSHDSMNDRLKKIWQEVITATQ